MAGKNPSRVPLKQHTDHSREWHRNFYVYPVISRRSGGLSIGVNLNPDTACNFDCIYCQVDRSGTPRVRDVDLAILRQELAGMIAVAQSGLLFQDPAMADVPEALRCIRDIAFSGDGEPTTCPVFLESVELAVELVKSAGLDECKLVVITDACYLSREKVAAALRVLDANRGEIWAKLDAGTESYYRQVNKPNYPLTHVIENIIAAGRERPLVIQSMFLRIDGVGPGESEIDAYLARLQEVLDGGARVSHVQVYTVARRPALSSVTPLDDAEVDLIAARVKAMGLEATAYYGANLE